MLDSFNFIGWQFWLAALIFFIVIEAATVSLVSTWFMIGALAALILDLTGASITVQVIVFFIVSTISLLFFLLVIKPKLNKKTEQSEKTNADRIVGQEGIVLLEINPLANTGQIRVKGQIWSASSYHDLIIPENSLIIVKEIKGVKAFVVPLNETVKNSEV
ncbi:MAG: NfeD family protein [Saccharofermentanales bacterium]|jgi:membrane protein implicated in regulation of membrane protease activity